VKLYSVPERPVGLIFDVDGTLYTHEAYFAVQTDVLVERLAERRGRSAAAMAAEIAAFRADWAASHGGEALSLGNAFTHFGVSIAESVRWREELIDPAAYLEPDPRLAATLAALAGRFKLAVVTNNPASVGRATLAALGVADHFAAVLGLDTCGVSKPHRDPFLRAAAALGAEPAACVSIGDRYSIDIALPLELGMGGVLVDGVADVYALPGLFAERGAP
jgi:phosphoglycolate phosphatase/putative hydrolase of the HAD superfamily